MNHFHEWFWLTLNFLRLCGVWYLAWLRRLTFVCSSSLSDSAKFGFIILNFSRVDWKIASFYGPSFRSGWLYFRSIYNFNRFLIDGLSILPLFVSFLLRPIALQKFFETYQIQNHHFSDLKLVISKQSSYVDQWKDQCHSSLVLRLSIKIMQSPGPEMISESTWWIKKQLFGKVWKCLLCLNVNTSQNHSFHRHE